MKKLTVLLSVACLSSGVLMGSVGTTIKAQLQNMNIVKDGNYVLQGTKVISYNGTTYVPLRAFGEVTGVDVSYNNGTVYLGNATQSIQTKKDKLDAYTSDYATIKPLSDMTDEIINKLYTTRDYSNSAWLEIAKQCKLLEGQNDVQMKTVEGKALYQKQKEMLGLLSDEINNFYKAGNNVTTFESGFTRINNKAQEMSNLFKDFLAAVNAIE